VYSVFIHSSLMDCRWVLEGDRPTVTALGWLVMQHLKEFQQTIVSELLNVAMLEKLLRYNTSSHNRAEVPALVAWSLSIVLSLTHTHTHTHFSFYME